MGGAPRAGFVLMEGPEQILRVISPCTAGALIRVPITSRVKEGKGRRSLGLLMKGHDDLEVLRVLLGLHRRSSEDCRTKPSLTGPTGGIADPEGFEPSTAGLEIRCPIRARRRVRRGHRTAS